MHFSRTDTNPLTGVAGGESAINLMPNYAYGTERPNRTNPRGTKKIGRRDSGRAEARTSRSGYPNSVEIARRNGSIFQVNCAEMSQILGPAGRRSPSRTGRHGPRRSARRSEHPVRFQENQPSRNSQNPHRSCRSPSVIAKNCLRQARRSKRKCANHSGYKSLREKWLSQNMEPHFTVTASPPAGERRTTTTPPSRLSRCHPKNTCKIEKTAGYRLHFSAKWKVFVAISFSVRQTSS